MDLEEGKVRLPEDRPAWGPRLHQYCNQKGIKALSDALRIYAPYTAEQLSSDPALNINVRERAHSAIEEAIKGFIAQTVANFTDKGILTVDPVFLFGKIGAELSPKYPEFTVPNGPAVSELIILHEVTNRLQNYLLANIALKESQHRKKTHKPKGSRLDISTHQKFFQLIDSPRAFLMMTGLSGQVVDQALGLRANYQLMKAHGIPFFQGKLGVFDNPDNKNKDQLKSENDRIALELIRRRKREIPLCTVSDEDLFQGKTTVFQFAGTKPDSNAFASCLAEINLFKEDLGESIASNPAMQEKLRPFSVNSEDLLVQLGELPRFSMDRFEGNIDSFGTGAETSKLLAGATPNYELTRRHVLWYLAQLTCHRGDIEDIFGVTFARRKSQPASPEDTTNSNPTKPGGPSTPDDVVDRSYPTKRARDAVNDTVESVHRPKTGRTGHTRLLPLVRRTNGSVIACKPSPKAQKLALDNQIQLAPGLENLSTGKVIYPEDMPAFLKSLEVATIEEAFATDPDNFIIRQETWVEGTDDDEPDQVRQAVRANIKPVV
ncbi:MAG: hypothetical protein AAB373_04655 [Patescibacteria group bacterium]